MDDDQYMQWLCLRMMLNDHYIKGKRIVKLAMLCELKDDKDYMFILLNSMRATLAAMRWATTCDR